MSAKTSRKLIGDAALVAFADFQPHVLARVAHQEDREHRPEDRVADAEIDRNRTQPVAAREIAGQESGDADGEIAGELVEADRQAAALRPDEIDLHDHRHRPGKALADAEQCVGGDDPVPARRPDDHERYRQAEQPAEDQDALAAPFIGKLPGDEVGEGFHHAEADDEGDDQRRRGDAEFLRADQRHDGALDADHAADEGVDQHQQRKLLPVGLEAERDRRAPRTATRHCAAAPAFAARVRAAPGGGGGMSAVMAETNAASSSMRKALLKRLSKPIVEVGLPLSERPQTEPEKAPGSTST